MTDTRLTTHTLATATLIGTALIAAPLPPKTVRNMHITLPTPAPEPATIANYDQHGSLWGHSTATQTATDIAAARADGATVEEWAVTDRAGNLLRIVRVTDVDTAFLGGIDIAVIPA
jgi:hypothetical protein